jgi:hypothetical protein
VPEAVTEKVADWPTVTVTFMGANEIPAAVEPVAPPLEPDPEPQAARPMARTASNIDERKLVLGFKFRSLKIADFYRKETSSSVSC